MSEYTGGGDPARTIELLWGTRRRAGRGPAPRLTPPVIAAAAVELADADGLEQLSMRRLAARVGMAPMSLYRYVPGKAELLDLMVDAVAAEAIGSYSGAGWRGELEEVARANYALFLRHPWLLRVHLGRPPLGPNVLAKYEAELTALAGSGLPDADLDRVLGVVLQYVRGAALGTVESGLADERTGRTYEEWWLDLAPYLERVFDAARYTLSARVGAAAASAAADAEEDAAHARFAFGLARLLDGIAAYVETRPRP